MAGNEQFAVILVNRIYIAIEKKLTIQMVKEEGESEPEEE